ncbi:MAG: hypothetical protein R2784_15600 [Saprospiraceae bacterium]
MKYLPAQNGIDFDFLNSEAKKLRAKTKTYDLLPCLVGSLCMHLLIASCQKDDLSPDNNFVNFKS